MGYRIRLGKVSKEDAEKYRIMDEDSLAQQFGEDFAPYRPPYHTEIYEIGKHVDFPEFRTHFYRFELEECEFDVMHRRGLERIIEQEHAAVEAYYQELKADPEQWERHIRHMASEWETRFRMCPYSLDPSKPLVGSWKREYAIFTLANIYRDFDWNKDILIYSGW